MLTWVGPNVKRTWVSCQATHFHAWWLWRSGMRLGRMPANEALPTKKPDAENRLSRAQCDFDPARTGRPPGTGRSNEMVCRNSERGKALASRGLLETGRGRSDAAQTHALDWVGPVCLEDSRRNTRTARSVPCDQSSFSCRH